MIVPTEGEERKSRTRPLQKAQAGSRENSQGAASSGADKLFLSASKAAKFSKVVPFNPSVNTVPNTDQGSSEATI